MVNKETLMKYLLLIITSLSWNAFGFDLIPHKDLSTGDLQILTARMQLNDRPFECLVDTGARHTMVQSKFVKDLPVIGTTLGGGISNPNQLTELVNANLKLGDWEIINATIRSTPRIPFECLIGNDFLMDKNFTIDIKKLTIQTTESESHENDLKLNIYKSDRGGHFGFNTIIANDSIEIIFDTGAGSTVIDLQFVKEHSEHFLLISEANVLDGNSTTLKSGLYKVDQLQFGDIVLKNVEIYALDLTGLKTKLPSVVGIIGMNIIKDFKWSFNMPESIFHYSKN